MKKLLTGLLAVGLVLALTLPAAAFDSEFGGYWRTRGYIQQNFTGSDTGAQDLKQVDTRTRLFYTAVFSEDFKFVNLFEYNLTWGDTSSTNAGGIASSTNDRNVFRIKSTYANFNLGNFNFLIGLQPRVISRGFLFDDDFAGVAMTYKGSNFSIPMIWMKAYEGGIGNNKNDNDVDYYVVKPIITLGNTTLTPNFMYLYSKDASKWAATTGNKGIRAYFAGLDADVKFTNGSAVWFTGLYEAGAADLLTGDSMDVSAYLLALGGTARFGAFDIHGRAFYASGDDRGTAKTYEAFFVPRGQMYYWAEIMGYGLFDNQASANSCADKISNVQAANIGVGFKATDKLNFTGDLWYAKLAKSDVNGGQTLGTEIDLRATYALMKNLNLDVVGAYLFAGDATYQGKGEKNAYEVGTMLSFSF
jgi:hypothetical protein